MYLFFIFCNGFSLDEGGTNEKLCWSESEDILAAHTWALCLKISLKLIPVCKL